ncbi:alpha/beta hydrolase [Paenibacillus sp. UNC451MF]|uniref:alpha/beta hydrolase n=1 Tax=Paenibacillus sp. UNC451MF TaxID=1449063 RepID=UPI0004907594|nr:alpha/beta hydrolase family protein [Paenibacillus sp. UNC451MF]
MALVHVEYFSEVLGLSSSMDVIIPQQIQRQPGRFKPPYPVLYLLHGGSDNHSNWQRNTAIERYVSGLGLVVVMPAVHYSFYSDQKYGLKYFTFLSEELPRLVQQFFHVSDQREDTFAAGLSMGGYGAFKLGIVCPDRYAAVASLSGSLDQRSRLTGEPVIANSIMLQMAKHTFGSLEEYDRSENDLAHVLEGHLADGVQLPKLYQACGTLDHNYEINKRFYEQFRDRMDVTYIEAPDRGHEWGFWDESIQQVLQWLPIRST